LTGDDNFVARFRRLYFINDNKTISTMQRNTPAPTVVAMIMIVLPVFPLTE
jgi:hypothetical protein